MRLGHISAPGRRRSLAAGAALLCFAGLLAGCSTGASTTADPTSSAATGFTLEKAKEQGYISIAVGNEPPYTKIETDGSVTGAEPDVLRAVAKELGIAEVKGVVSTYDGMIPGLAAGRWDAIAAGLFMKQSRCSQVIYTSPVIVSTESFAVPAGNPKSIKTIADIVTNTDLKIAVLNGGFEEGILKTAGFPNDRKVAVKDNQSGVEALASNRVDAFLLPTLSLKDLQKTNGGFDVTDPIPDAPKTGSGAAFALTSADFAKAYNDKLEEFKKTDEFAAILTKWGFDPEAAQGVTVDELCQTEG